MRLKYLFFTALLGLAGTAFAATPVPVGPTANSPGSAAGMPHHDHGGADLCKTHADECKADAAKFDTWCAANADKCTAVKAWNEKRIEFCSAHEKECAEHRKMMMEHAKQYCSKNPAEPHCHAIVAKHQPGDNSDNDEGGGDMPPPPSK